MPTEKEMLAMIAELRRLEENTMAAYRAVEEATKANQLRIAMIKEYILAHTFPGEPPEGTSHRTCPGYRLTCEQAIERKVDEPVLSQLMATFAKLGIPVPTLIRRKPELSVREYRKLTAKQRHAFDRALIIKPKKPTLTVTAYAGQKE